MPKTSLDLTGKWQFKEYPPSARRMRDLKPAGWLTTPLPCSIFNSLITAGKIKQTDINTNPEKLVWVSQKHAGDALSTFPKCPRRNGSSN